jgi:hypothetical protein
METRLKRKEGLCLIRSHSCRNMLCDFSICDARILGSLSRWDIVGKEEGKNFTCK